jgi:hypothetical protein
VIRVGDFRGPAAKLCAVALQRSHSICSGPGEPRRNRCMTVRCRPAQLSVATLRFHCVGCFDTPQAATLAPGTQARSCADSRRFMLMHTELPLAAANDVSAKPTVIAPALVARGASRCRNRASRASASKTQRRSAADGADARGSAGSRHAGPRAVAKAEFGSAAAAPQTPSACISAICC